MYVTTFYSFKGGVGRSMALANAAVELARRGRRVLAVDFDLEAPGLDTFDLPRPPVTPPGIVEYVSEYISTGQAPSVEEFVFESPGVGSKGGSLWFMPSGAHTDSYAVTLASIDWAELYELHDGYLLFEDLKEQWKTLLGPDYVFIDSRTGHTDVGGICTRQLPDAVAILFFPNEQNLRGLTKVVKDIRSEEPSSGRKPTQLHFVMSNVPDLDDEDRIIDQSIAAFKEGLGFRDLSVIHRYDSLSLLNQVVFTRDRPNSRLSKEYCSIVDKIVLHNPSDREGVLRYVKHRARLSRGSRSLESATEGMEQYAKTVEQNLRDDPEVLFRLGMWFQRVGSTGRALGLFDQAIDGGLSEPEVFLCRARERRWEADGIEGAREDARSVLGSSAARTYHVVEAINIIGPNNLGNPEDWKGLSSKEPFDRYWIAKELNKSRSSASFALALLRPLLAQSQLRPALVERIRLLFVLCAIATGRFSEAIKAIEAKWAESDEMEIDAAFNYGMALWGHTDQIASEPFARALELFGAHEGDRSDPNQLQCMAVASWAVGSRRNARELAARARSAIRSPRNWQFSCWRYLEVSGSEFKRDLKEFLAMVDGQKRIRPPFLKAVASG